VNVATENAVEPTGAAVPEKATQSRWRDLLSRSPLEASELGLVGALLAIVVFFWIFAPNFMTTFNLLNVLQQVTIVAIAAAGGTMVILVAGIDLSVVSAVALTGVSAALFLENRPEYGVAAALVAILLAITVGIVAGLLNGVIITTFKVPDFIGTLATFSILRGVALLITRSYPINIPRSSEGMAPYEWLGVGKVSVFGLDVPFPIFVMAGVYLLGYVILHRLKVGRRIYALGGNATAARLSGVRVGAVRIFVYAFAGFTAAITGIIVSSRLASGQPAGSQGFELDVIAAVVIGGTSLMGGRGKLVGTFLGALVLAIMVNGLLLMNVNEFWQRIVKGCVIVVAVVIDTYVRRRGPSRT
jgi:ribose transport system permease protein